MIDRADRPLTLRAADRGEDQHGAGPAHPRGAHRRALAEGLACAALAAAVCWSIAQFIPPRIGAVPVLDNPPIGRLLDRC
jgi:hypothetical protein